MKGLIQGMFVAGVVAGLVIGFSASVEARPNYKKAFDTTYEKVAKDNKTNCNVCHKEGTDDKKMRNNYGEAYGAIPKAPHAFPEIYTEEPEQSGQRRVLVKRAGELD